jgi:hypothetical protein
MSRPFKTSSSAVVHRVAGHQLHVGHGLAHAALQDGINVGEKEKLRVAVGFGNLRLEGREDIQLCIVRLGFVDVFQIGALPEEALARGVLNAARVDVARLEDGLLPLAEVLADDSDDAHIGKEAG